MAAYDDPMRPRGQRVRLLVWSLRLVALAVVVRAQLLRVLVRVHRAIQGRPLRVLGFAARRLAGGVARPVRGR